MNQNLDLRACIHCRHFERRPKDGKPRCLNVAAQRGLSPVDGRKVWATCAEMRGNPKLCGPTGRLFEAAPTPVRDRVQAARMAIAWSATQVACGVAWPMVAAHAKVRRLREAWAMVRDNTGREGVPVQPLEAEPPVLPEPPAQPAQPAQLPVPVPVPEKPKPSDGTMAAVMAGVIAVLIAGYVLAGLMSMGEGSAAETASARCVARKPSAICCYRMPDGSTRCYDCSDTAGRRKFRVNVS